MLSNQFEVEPETDRHSLEELPLVLKGMGQYFPEGDSISKPSRHDSYELTYVRSGKLDYIIKGKRYHLVPGSTIVLQPDVMHSYVVLEECDVACVYFSIRPQVDSSTGQPQVNLDPYADFLTFANAEGELDETKEQSQDAMMIKGKGRREIAAVVEAIITENRQHEYGKVLMLQALGLQLLVEFSRALKAEWEESLKVKTGKAKELVHIAKGYIEANFDQNISVADIAGHVFLSQGYFARAFRDEMGMSPMAYLMQVRVTKACELLQESDMKVSTIARRVGFSSPQRFNAAFRKQMNSTPMTYRKIYQDGEGVLPSPVYDAFLDDEEDLSDDYDDDFASDDEIVDDEE